MFRFLGIGFLLACTSTLFALQECVRDKAPKIDDGLYEFQYDSGVVQTDVDRFLFHRCVLNHKPQRRMWVDWEKTGVSGTTNKKGIIRNGVDSRSKEFDDVSTNLWYGFQPKKKNSTYREVKNDPKKQNAFLGGTLRSSVIMGLSTKKARNKEEEVNLKVTDVEIEMESSAINVTGFENRVLYTYSWRNRAKLEEKERFSLRFPKELKKHFASTPEFRENSLFLDYSTRGAYFVSRSRPIQKVIRVEFMPEEGREPIGSAQMSIFWPEK